MTVALVQKETGGQWGGAGFTKRRLAAFNVSVVLCAFAAPKQPVRVCVRTLVMNYLSERHLLL